MGETISEQTWRKAQKGDAGAREALVRALQDRVYGLAVRMLGHPADAEEGTQEILLRILQKLPSFRGDSELWSWAYRVAANYLLNAKKSRLELAEPDFEKSARQLDAALSAATNELPSTDRVLIREVKIFCTQGMLLCLDRDQRIAYILGEILELPGEQAASIAGVSHATFRKRVSRARAQLTEFMRARCGLVDPERNCRCQKLVAPTVHHGLVDPNRPRFASHPSRTELVQFDETVDKLRSAAEVFRSHPDYAAPDVFVERLKEALEASDL